MLLETAEEAETMFRSFLSSGQEAEDGHPFDPEECLPILPFEDSASSEGEPGSSDKDS